MVKYYKLYDYYIWLINSSIDFSVFGKKKVDLATYNTYFPGIYFILIYLPTYLLQQSRLTKKNSLPLQIAAKYLRSLVI